MSQRLSDEQIAKIVAMAEGNGFGRHVTTINLEDFHAVIADLEEARAALQRTQWVYDWYCHGGSVPMGMICAVCGNHRPEGHKPDCVVGNALGGSEQSS